MPKNSNQPKKVRSSLVSAICGLKKAVCQQEITFDKAYEQIKDFDLQLARNLHLDSDNTKDFEKLRDSYRAFVQSKEGQQSQKLNDVASQFESYCSAQKKNEDFFPIFSDAFTYYDIAVLIFKMRLDDLKTLLKKRNLAVFGMFTKTIQSSQTTQPNQLLTNGDQQNG